MYAASVWPLEHSKIVIRLRDSLGRVGGTLHSAHCTLHTAHRTPHTAHRTPHTAHHTPQTAIRPLHTQVKLLPTLAVQYRSAGDHRFLDQPDTFETSGGRKEEVDEEASSREHVQPHLSSLRSTAGVSGVVK